MCEVLTMLKSLQGLPLTGLGGVEVAHRSASLKIIMEFIAVVKRGKT